MSFTGELMKLIAVIALAAGLSAQTRVNPGQIGPIIPSAATLVIPSTTGQYAGSPWFGITGSTAITSMSGAFIGQQGTLSTLNGPVTFNASATIAASCTTTPGATYTWYFDGIIFWVVGPGCTSGPVSPPGGLGLINVTLSPYFADNTGTKDSTVAFQSAAIYAFAHGGCVYAPTGVYKVSNGSGLASIILSSSATVNGCLTGDGPGQSIILQNTNNGVTVGVQGGWITVRDVFFAQEPGVSGATPISIYPDITANSAYAEADRTRIEDVEIDYQYCGNVGSDAPPASCAKPSTSINFLTSGILVQSGVKDSLFHIISNVNIKHAIDGIHFWTGGAAGSTSGGAVEATSMTAVTIANVTNCIHFTSSLRNTVRGFQCDFATSAYKFDTQSTGFYAGQTSGGNDVEWNGGETVTYIADWGSAAEGNHLHINTTMALNGNSMTGSAGQLNYIDAFDNFQTGFHGAGITDGYLVTGIIGNPSIPPTATFQVNATPNIADVERITSSGHAVAGALDYIHYNPFGQSIGSGTYTSGGSITGTSGQVCFLTVTGGSLNATAVIALTGTNTIAGGTVFSVISGGIFTSSPVSATLSTPASPSPAASCSGTVVVSTLLTMPGFAEQTAVSFPYGGVAMHHFKCGNTNGFSVTRYCVAASIDTPIGNANGDFSVLSDWLSGIVNGSLDGTTYSAWHVDTPGGFPIIPIQIQGNGLPGGILLANLGSGFACTHGSNATCGVATLSSGTVTVSTTAVAALATTGAGQAVNLVLQSCSSCGALSVGTVSPGTSFVINSTSGADASKVYWRIDYVR